MNTENRFRRIAGEEELTLDYFFNDGLHPTEECHRLMFNYLIKQLGFAV
jgi:phospholipase/lecithinase/hemolysin